MAIFSGAAQACGTSKASGLGPMMRALPSALTLLAVAACAQVPGTKTSHSKIDPIWGVEAPKKKVADGQPVPPGGGRYQVGKPYMVGGRLYFPHDEPNYDKVGSASWYGHDDHGRETANGEVYDKDSLSAAHPTLPIPSYARVTNMDNGRSVIVRINDRGPYVDDRLVDVSERTADLLGFKGKGLGHVRLQYIGPAPVEGSDQRMLVASLRGPGTPASITQDRTLIARADRTPSDGRMTGLALANMAPPIVVARPKPIMLAAATEQEISYAQRPVPRPIGYGTQAALPPPPRPMPAAQIAIAPTQAYPSQVSVTRSQLPPNTLGTLPARALATSNAPRPAGTGSTLGQLPAEGDDDASPLQLSPAKPSSPAPGAIARAPVTPSRYGPAGQVVYRVQQTQGFIAEAKPTAAASAIDHLIAVNVGPAAAHIDLGSYAHPENAARVAELMQPYGAIRTTAIRGGLGEQLTLVQLDPSSGIIPGDVIAIADRLGIHSAMLVE
jgi:rare lipoprotein A